MSRLTRYEIDCAEYWLAIIAKRDGWSVEATVALVRPTKAPRRDETADVLGLAAALLRAEAALLAIRRELGQDGGRGPMKQPWDISRPDVRVQMSNVRLALTEMGLALHDGVKS